MRRGNGSLYLIDRKHPAAWLSVFFMCTAAALRLIYYTGRPAPAAQRWIYLWNVVAAAVIFVVAVLFFGERMPQLTVISVGMGVFFFVVKAFTFPSLTHTVLCVILYTAVLVLYSLTVFGIIPTKYLLYPLFGLPLLYHIFVEDMQIYILADPRPPVREWLPEISVLCIMASLLSLSVSMKRREEKTRKTSKVPCDC